jgi:predicted AAA+ superfamily ATPase
MFQFDRVGIVPQNLLESFREAYRNLELLPLVHPKELQQLKVDYGDEIIEELEQLVKDSPSGDGKIVFTGHRGCGKSTLLADFSERLRDDYFVVFFSIAAEIEMSDVNHINILFAIALKLISEAEFRQIAIPKKTQEALSKWFASRTRTETERN